MLDGGGSFRDALLDAPEIDDRFDAALDALLAPKAIPGSPPPSSTGCWPARRERPIETAPGTRRDAIDVFPFPIRRRGAYILPARLG